MSSIFLAFEVNCPSFLWHVQHIPMDLWAIVFIFVWHVQHIILDFHFLGSRDLKYVLLAHTTERNLLLYGKALL